MPITPRTANDYATGRRRSVSSSGRLLSTSGFSTMGQGRPVSSTPRAAGHSQKPLPQKSSYTTYFGPLRPPTVAVGRFLSTSGGIPRAAIGSTMSQRRPISSTPRAVIDSKRPSWPCSSVSHSPRTVEC